MEKQKSIKTTARKSIKIDSPDQYFYDWSYFIDRPRWATLGLTQRTFMKNLKPYLAWAIDNIPKYEFSSGYVYYKKPDSKVYLLIANPYGDGYYEVHTGTVGDKSIRAYKITGTMIEEWLKTGEEPTDAPRLWRGEGKDGVYPWLVEERPADF